MLHTTRELKRNIYTKSKRIFASVVSIFELSVLVLVSQCVLVTWTEAYRSPVACFYRKLKCDIPQAHWPNVTFPIKSIFFLETSCRGTLTSRQACSVESAARANPNWQINVLFTAPISIFCLKTKPFSRLIYPNIKYYRINIAQYGKRTPLESLLSHAKQTLNNSRWPVHHASDILKFLTIYKWGGVYLDLDMIVVKSFDTLPLNWAVKEDYGHLASGAFAASYHKIGRLFMDEIVRSQKKFRPHKWLANGNELLTKALKVICSTNFVVEMSAKKCQGIEIFEPPTFYPVHYSNWKTYFQQFQPEELNLNGTYTHHLWNRLSYKEKASKKTLLWNLAKKYCPRIHHAYNKRGYFGSPTDHEEVNIRNSHSYSYKICQPKTSYKPNNTMIC